MAPWVPSAPFVSKGPPGRPSAMIAGTYNAQIKASCSLSLPWIFLIHNFSIFLLPLVLPARESQLVLHVLLHSLALF